MQMNVNENVIRKIEQIYQARLLRAGHMLATALKTQLSTSFPPASRTGQFPRYRTGSGRDAVAVIAVGMKVLIGFRKMANFDYMPFLELFRHRLGLMYQYKQMKPILAAVIEGRNVRT